MSYIIFPNQLFYDKKYLQSIKKYSIYLVMQVLVVVIRLVNPERKVVFGQEINPKTKIG